jgi:hypothetical protein
MSVGELIRDGLQWRLEEGDPLAYRYVAPPVQENMSIPVIPSHPPVTPEPTEPAGDASVACPGFDPAKFALSQKLCKRGHAWGQTGKSLMWIKDSMCVECKKFLNNKYREAKARAKSKRKAPRS